MKNKTGILSKIYMALIMLFLYAPIAVLIFYSFNDGKTTVWKGFTLKWYSELFRDSNIINSLGNTLIIQNVSNIPIISPDIVMGVSLMLLFTTLGVIFNFEMGFVTVLIAHICFCVPFVVLNVMPRITRMDRSIYDAALDLGCNQWQARL